jgi:hypothetical protein
VAAEKGTRDRLENAETGPGGSGRHALIHELAERGRKRASSRLRTTRSRRQHREASSDWNQELGPGLQRERDRYPSRETGEYSGIVARLSRVARPDSSNVVLLPTAPEVRGDAWRHGRHHRHRPSLTSFEIVRHGPRANSLFQELDVHLPVLDHRKGKSP